MMMSYDTFSTNHLAGSFYKYQYVDQGAQFRVYAIQTVDGSPTGRVIKVPLSFVESKQILEPHLQLLDMTEAAIDKTVHSLLWQKQQLPTLLQGVYAQNKQLMDLLGNIKIVPRLAVVADPDPGYFLPLFFTQDIITPMAHFMHRFRFASLPPYRLSPGDVRIMERLIQQIIQLHYCLWEFGIFECGFKLENVGINESKRQLSTTLVDIGEYTPDIDEAEAILIEQRWRNALNAQKTDHLFIPSILHHYYIDVCNKALTVEALHKRWRRRSLHLEKRSSRLLRMKEFLAWDPQKEITHWMQRQTLSTTLYSGVPQDRIDDLEIPHEELTYLLRDNQASSTYLNTIRLHEQAERKFFIQQQAPTDPRDLGRYILRQPDIRPLQ